MSEDNVQVILQLTSIFSIEKVRLLQMPVDSVRKCAEK